MTRLLLLVAIGMAQFGAQARQGDDLFPPEKAPAECRPDHLNESLVCDCLLREPWCENDKPVPPHCCKLGEGKAVRCGCCPRKTTGSGIAKLCEHG